MTVTYTTSVSVPPPLVTVTWVVENIVDVETTFCWTVTVSVARCDTVTSVALVTVTVALQAGQYTVHRRTLGDTHRDRKHSPLEHV